MLRVEVKIFDDEKFIEENTYYFERGGYICGRKLSIPFELQDGQYYFGHNVEIYLKYKTKEAQ